MSHKVSASYVKRLAKIDRICKQQAKKQADFLARVSKQAELKGETLLMPIRVES